MVCGGERTREGKVGWIFGDVCAERLSELGDKFECCFKLAVDMFDGAIQEFANVIPNHVCDQLALQSKQSRGIC